MVEIFWITVGAVLILLTWRSLRSTAPRPPSADRAIRDAREQLREMTAESADIHKEIDALKTTLADRHKAGGLNIEIHGEAQRNADGTSRQDIIAQLKEGEYVTLVPESDNPHDPYAVRVDSELGTIGYVPRDDAAHVGGLITHGVLAKSYIGEIRGGNGGYNYGVVLHLETALEHTARHQPKTAKP
jgi:hypothetical protein